MRKINFALILFSCFVFGCAGFHGRKLVVWETKDISRNYEILGPVSVTEDVEESTGQALQGLAGYLSKDGRVSGQIPAEMKTSLDAKRESHKEMIFEKLGDKAKDYDADAVIGAEYAYLPPYASFSKKATVSAKGTMVKYK